MPGMSETTTIRCPHCGATNRVPSARLGDAPRCGRCRGALFTGAPLALDEAGLDRWLSKETIPLLADFWAPWCGPCLQMAPAFAAAAAELEPRVRLAKVDTEAAPGVGARFGIRGIPTLILFRSGREAARQAGAMTKEGVVAWARAGLGG